MGFEHMEGGFVVEFRKDHVHVLLDPAFEVTPETQDGFWREVAKICKRHKTRRLLVEGAVPSGERDVVEVADAGQRTGVIPKLWLAFHLEGFVPNERSELFEAIAATKGVRVKFFSEAAPALKWLRLNTPR